MKKCRNCGLALTCLGEYRGKYLWTHLVTVSSLCYPSLDHLVRATPMLHEDSMLDAVLGAI